MKMSKLNFFSWLKKKAGWTSKNIRHSPMDKCLNCDMALEAKDHYCRSCGQKIHESKLTFWSLFSEFFAGIFNLENGFYRSIGRILFPSYLSKQFIQGRRKKYLNPIRFFVVSLLIHIAVLNFLIDTEKIQQLTNNNIEKIGKGDLYDRFLLQRDSLLATGVNTSQLDTIESQIFAGVTPSQKDTFPIQLNFKFGSKTQYHILNKEVYEAPITEVLEKHKVQSFVDRLVITQMLRALRDLPGALRYVIGNIVWGVIVSILLLGMLMKLLYWRRRSYYVEHIVVLCHIHAFAFLIASIGFLLADFQISSDAEVTTDFKIVSATPVLISYTLIALYFFLTIKKYYHQGWIKSFIKFVILAMAYMFILLIIVMLILFISMAFFK